MRIFIVMGCVALVTASVFSPAAWAQDQPAAEAPAVEAPAAEAPAAEIGAVTDYQPEVAANDQVEPAEVWWGNRGVAYRNYIPVQGPDCQGECKYCDKNMICCRTGCVCATCEYICDDCHDCPPTYFDKIFFDLDKSVLRPDAIIECNKVLDYMRANPGRAVQIEGHCCDLATETYNVGLGQRRADSVARYLVENGVSADRISTQTYGETRPWVGVDQRELNRRAVVIVLPEAVR